MTRMSREFSLVLLGSGILTAGYFLWTLQRVNLGTLPDAWRERALPDVTAVEMMGRLTLRFGVQSGRRLAEPQLRTPAPPSNATNRGPHYATTAHGPDLFAASQQAVRYMIEHLVESRGLSREQAYVVCSVAVDLKISEIVDAPNWIVSAFVPESIFV